MNLVAEVFEVKEDEYQGVALGIGERLGMRRSMLGSAVQRPLLMRPVGEGSCERPDVGLVIAYVPADGSADDPVAALVDISLWPPDARVRAPGARSKKGVASAPYMLNLCVAPAYLRRGMARSLLALAERVVRDAW